ncbi:haloacid dehalogenase [Bdellovibrio sp. qaytius]|nr:haloacid dehalogenase [Bdellovibrio sp. qaytius]
MNYKPYPNEFWTSIEKTILELKNAQKPLIAAFDADGTLWDTDLGENFFHYQIDNKQVPLPPNPFEHYLEMKKINNDPRAAYVWLAQINQGQSLEQVCKWAQQAFETIKPNPIFSEQQRLIELLKSHGVKIYIVTASIKWAVEPGAIAIGLSADNVIGVETAIKDGIITDAPVLPITYRAGKVEALLAQSKQAPFLASGNTMGDFELLQSATHLRLAVSAASRDDRLFKTELELANEAKNKNWMQHRFI